MYSPRAIDTLLHPFRLPIASALYSLRTGDRTMPYRIARSYKLDPSFPFADVVVSTELEILQVPRQLGFNWQSPSDSEGVRHFEINYCVGTSSEIAPWLVDYGEYCAQWNQLIPYEKNIDQLTAEVDLECQVESSMMVWVISCGGKVHGTFVAEKSLLLPKGFKLDTNLVLDALERSVYAGRTIKLQTGFYRHRQKHVHGVPTHTLYRVDEVSLPSVGDLPQALVSPLKHFDPPNHLHAALRNHNGRKTASLKENFHGAVPWQFCTKRRPIDARRS
ncbi:hypothetical protein C8F01DRAFT_1249223 [Mycena amicta]|nr:hypothetical protein C8F01DRAFT_1249223 [Mycena amicta]